MYLESDDSAQYELKLHVFSEFSACLPRIYINHRPPWNHTRTTYWCCLLEMFTKVIVICWCSRIAVLKNINVGCSCGNLYDNIITYNIILYMLTFTQKKTNGPEAIAAEWLKKFNSKVRLNFILSLINDTSAYSFYINDLYKLLRIEKKWLSSRNIREFGILKKVHFLSFLTPKILSIRMKVLCYILYFLTCFF